MILKKATDIFSEWALQDRDSGMQKNHMTAVNTMLNELVHYQKAPFSFVDAGCGNGWVVRKINKHPLCSRAIGVDGALEMIRKAEKIDPNGEYIHSELLKWEPDIKVDFVHSMEVIYYFENPMEIISHIVNNWMKFKGRIIMGIDYYTENKKSHSWPYDLKTNMALLSKKDWIEVFNACGLKNINIFQTNAEGDFPGTLVVNGTKIK